MVKRRPHLVQIMLKSAGSYDEHGVYSEGLTSIKSISCRRESANIQAVMVNGESKKVNFRIYVSLKDLDGLTIPENSKCNIGGHYYDVVKVELLQTHVIVWA
jgi:hypothetical protein